MAILPIRRHQTNKQRVVSAAGKAVSATWTLLKACVAWVAGQKAARVAVPAAAAAGTAAVVAKKRSAAHHDEDPSANGVNAAAPTTPAGVA
jgi:hypothetical protein